ncbi:protein jagged-1-like [Ahaetulla prasina]|uniref:protein jagged-1-like n=1 Tax=Ahaetulla prasina TaxID=499056 RepID=UPI002647B7AF|nr:protein jagged-1-like [Ahaetulla prasina]
MRLRPRAPGMLRCAPPAMLLLLLLLLLHARLQVSGATGVVELQVSLVQNEKGVLADGRCCRGGREPPCPVAEPCRTFFRVCLKEYQLRAQPGGPCVLGAASTPVLGGNVFSAPLQKLSDRDGTMVIPFDFAWPRSYSLVLEAWDAVNASDVTSPGSGQLIERVTRSGMVNPGEGWQHLRHHGRSTLLECRLRVRCHEHYYGPSCNLLCRPRDDFFGHHSCDAAGNKVCLDGWTGNKCQRAVCRQGCHKTHGFCVEPGECRCHYGWAGPHCDRCLLFPGCVHGSCTRPWKCDCETNWGGLLCDKDLNYCGSHRPCQNGGTCANKEPNEYECFCPGGFGGRNCENALLPLPTSSPPCPSELCANGGSCHPTPSGPQCVCPLGWRGKACRDDVNECHRKPCLHARACRNLAGSYFCDCLPGWTGTNCSIRMNLCQMRCQNGGTCQMEADRQTCLCQPGYTGAECETEQRSCRDAPCLHGGQCQQAENQTFFCRCPLGVSGKWCEVSANLCSANPCPKGAICQDGGGGRYTCLCPEGATCQTLQDPCLGETNVGLLSAVLLPVLLLAGGVPVLVLLLLLCLQRRFLPRAPGRTEPPANNSLRSDAVHLIRNITRKEAERGPGAADSMAKTAGLPAGLPPPSPRLSKVDISNQQRAKLNQLHVGPVLARPPL